MKQSTKTKSIKISNRYSAKKGERNVIVCVAA